MIEEISPGVEGKHESIWYIWDSWMDMCMEDTLERVDKRVMCGKRQR